MVVLPAGVARQVLSMLSQTLSLPVFLPDPKQELLHSFIFPLSPWKHKSWQPQFYKLSIKVTPAYFPSSKLLINSVLL